MCTRYLGQPVSTRSLFVRDCANTLADFNINSTFETLAASSCTSCQIQGDKSAYWTPQFYFAHADGTYEEVPNSGMTVYYLGRGEDDGNRIKPFPPGLKMVSGDNSARSLNTKSVLPGGRLLAERTSFACVNYAKPAPETNNLANIDCPQGLRAQIHFQSCWDGKNLYKPDQSHVAYLSRIDGGVCPPTHPVLLPHLFFEVNYSMDKIDTFKGGKYMFANGDTTGYSFHGDFMNAWDEKLLTDAIDQCMVDNKNPSGVADECGPFKATNNAEKARLCSERSPVFPCEPVHGRITSLPGCTKNGDSITCSSSAQPVCAANYNTLGLSAYSGNDEFSYKGCYNEPNGARALEAKRYDDAEGMTVKSCLAFCAGFKYAALEYAQECYCGNTLTVGTNPADSDKCDMPCKGNVYQKCGAGRLMNLYEAKATGSSSSVTLVSSTSATPPSTTIASSISRPSSTSTPTSTTPASTRLPTSISTSVAPTATGVMAQFKYNGCWTEAPGRALNLDSFSSDQMTPEACATYCAKAVGSFGLFGVEYGRECWCGSALRAGSINAPESDCSKPCTGDSNVMCGNGDRLGVYSRLDYSPPSIPQTVTIGSQRYNHAGCYSEGSNSRALRENSTTSNSMTVEFCGNFCQGHSMFGLEWGVECYCGNKLETGATLRPASECSKTCPGDYRQLACGEGQRLNVYTR